MRVCMLHLGGNLHLKNSSENLKELIDKYKKTKEMQRLGISKKDRTMIKKRREEEGKKNIESSKSG